MLTPFLFALAVALLAYTWSVKLTQAEMVLGPVARFAHFCVELWPWTEWILKPLLLCERCVAGQLALWGYWYIIGYTHERTRDDAFLHLLTIALAILFAEWIGRAEQKLLR